MKTNKTTLLQKHGGKEGQEDYICSTSQLYAMDIVLMPVELSRSCHVQTFTNWSQNSML